MPTCCYQAKTILLILIQLIWLLGGCKLDILVVCFESIIEIISTLRHYICKSSSHFNFVHAWSSKTLTELTIDEISLVLPNSVWMTRQHVKSVCVLLQSILLLSRKALWRFVQQETKMNQDKSSSVGDNRLFLFCSPRLWMVIVYKEKSSHSFNKRNTSKRPLHNGLRGDVCQHTTTRITWVKSEVWKSFFSIRFWCVL